MTKLGRVWEGMHLIALVFNLWLLVFILVRLINRTLQEIEEQERRREE